MGIIHEKTSELVESFEKLITFMAVKNRQVDLFEEEVELGSFIEAQIAATVKLEKEKTVGYNFTCSDKEIKILYNH